VALGELKDIAVAMPSIKTSKRMSTPCSMKTESRYARFGSSKGPGCPSRARMAMKASLLAVPCVGGPGGSSGENG
jgi:hypothetical protein